MGKWGKRGEAYGREVEGRRRRMEGNERAMVTGIGAGLAERVYCGPNGAMARRWLWKPKPRRVRRALRR